MQSGKKFQFKKHDELLYYDLKEEYGSETDSSILEDPSCTHCGQSVESIKEERWENWYYTWSDNFKEKNGREPTNEEYDEAYEEYLKTL